MQSGRVQTDKIDRFEVIISENAAEMLVTHTCFMAEVNQQAADNLRKTIVEAAKFLQHFPERNPYISDPSLTANKYRKMTVNKQYLLLYQVQDKVVYIDYVVDCRQDYRWLL